MISPQKRNESFVRNESLGVLTSREPSPSLEPSKPLIEFGMSADGPHMYQFEKRGMRTVEKVQSRLGLVHRGWSRTKSPKWKRETIIISSMLNMG